MKKSKRFEEFPFLCPSNVIKTKSLLPSAQGCDVPQHWLVPPGLWVCTMAEQLLRTPGSFLTSASYLLVIDSMGRAGDGGPHAAVPPHCHVLLSGMECHEQYCIFLPRFQLCEKKTFKVIRDFTAYGHQQLAHLGREEGKSRMGVLGRKAGRISCC